MKKRILALLMCLTLIFSSSSVAFAAEYPGGVFSEEQSEAVGTVEDTKTSNQETVTLHFKNSNGWSSVNAYAWVDDQTQLLGTWPGTAVTENSDHAGYYTVEVTTDSNFKCIFNNGTTQTDDITVEWSSENSEFWLNADGNSSLTNSTPLEWDVKSPVVNGNTITFNYVSSSETRVRVTGEMDNWAQSLEMTKVDDRGIWSYSCELLPGSYEYKFVVGDNTNNEGWKNDPLNKRYKDGTDNNLLIVPGLLDADDIEAARGEVNALPVQLDRLAEDGTQQKVNVSYSMKSTVEGITLDSENKTLTVDADCASETVELIATAENGETATVTVAIVAAGAVVVSPEVDGSSITFRYKNKTASEVYLAGNMTNWDDNKVLMSKNEETGIWSVTINNLSAGQYQYKFVVDGTWVTDPRNEYKSIEGDQENSLAVVYGKGDATDKITVKFHYTRTDGDYTDWNLWLWSDSEAAKQYNFVNDNGDYVATVELDAYANNSVSYIPRKGEWVTQDNGDRSFDISDVVAGTVHYYVTSGVTEGTRVLGDDVLLGVKIKKAEYDRTNNRVILTSPVPIMGNLNGAFTVNRATADGTGESLGVTAVGYSRSGTMHRYTLTLGTDISSLKEVVKSYTVSYDGHTYPVVMPNLYATTEFENAYTYTTDDLGATWTKESTTFKLWAPTADNVVLNLYQSGTAGTDDLIKTVQMNGGGEADKGVWSTVVEGDLNGTYYTYSVTVDGKVNEACDPYARTTGVNGKRAMVIDLDSTDPEGWENDKSPNKGMDQTDAIIYELHVRDLSNDANSGITNKGKYLGVTETGTTNSTGQSTGLDHIIDLGVTHIHFLPIYDYGSVDETKLDTAQFNWGYDPVNYNVPEGSYSTDPYNGEVRVKELKEMVQTLHENNINVIMDVVYNHVYDAGAFSFNLIVPDYFSRTAADGSYSSTSGCGNDTASERDMVRKYIVESVVYWAEEYHIDGFRFDLVGLLDTETINQVVEEVHKINPSIVFYGEGWDMDSTLTSKDVDMAKQGNASKTPGFAYFSDTIRDLLKGKNDETSLGYVNGATGQEEPIANAFMAKPWWTTNPSQIVNYASCHDNYTLKDKLNATRSDASEADRIKMNNLAASIYMLAEGIPLIHAGEEMLRIKVDTDGTIIHNSYNASDAVNNLKWSDLSSEDYQDVVDYYAGLIEFRKNHESLRLDTAEEVAANVKYVWVTNEVVLFDIKGNASVAGEVSDGIVVIFNATEEAKEFNLYEKGVDEGTWQVCIDDEKAGIEVLDTITDGNVTVDPISALVLVKGETVDDDSVYLDNGYVPDSEDDNNDNNNTVAVDSITLDMTTADLGLGGAFTLKATVNPSNATDKTVTWTSSDTKVVTVDQNGYVKAVAQGTATITATAGGKTATCTVTVTAPPAIVEVTSVTLNKTSATLKKGETVTLTATVAPSNATNKTVTWTTSNSKVATVDANGKVTAVAEGTATITATADGKSATCTVTVKATEEGSTPEPTPTVIEVTSVTLNKTSAALKKGKTVTLTATVAPSNATNKAVTWTTSNSKVATVDNTGKVTAVGNGTATITAKAGSKSATCTITVTTDVTKVKLNKSKLTMGVGKTYKLKATITPSDASNQKLTWSSSNKKIATVDKNGKITAKKAGTVTITVKTANGKKASCKVTIVKATLNATSLPLKVKTSTTALKVTSTLDGDKVKSWKSSNSKIVKVDKNGKLTAGSKTGKATITVTMKSGATAKCTVTVQKGKVTTKKLTIDQKKVTLQKGKKVKLTVTRNPISATEKITWTSSNKKIATVNSKGVVTGKKAGTVTITAKTSNGKKITCKVTVKNPKVTLEKTKATLKVGKTTTIKIKSTFPENDTVVSYTSSNKKVATVNKNGKVTAKKAGTATITVKMKSGAKVKFKVTVTK